MGQIAPGEGKAEREEAKGRLQGNLRGSLRCTRKGRGGRLMETISREMKEEFLEEGSG